MIPDRRLLACAVLSIVGHVAFARALRGLPPRADASAKRTVSIRVVSPPVPTPEPELAPLPTPPVPTPLPPKLVPRDRPRTRPNTTVAPTTPPRDVPPVEHPGLAGDDAPAPVFGVTMESTSTAGSGPAMPVGNTARPTQQRPAGGQGSPATAVEPVAAYEVTTMPLPQGRCVGQYTDEAKKAGIEGTVVLDLVVDENGRARDIHVVSGLDHGLTQAAIVALKGCRFSPGEKDGVPVPVRVRGFKIRFLQDQ